MGNYRRTHLGRNWVYDVDNSVYVYLPKNQAVRTYIESIGGVQSLPAFNY